MEFDQLRYFLQIAERESFTRAAEDLVVSQPALSRAIARLEDELGQPVFERQTRCLKLTDAGLLLQSRARQILDLIEDTKAEITDDGVSGRVRIAAIPTIAPYFVPDLLRRFAERHPQAIVVVQEDTTENTLRRCTQGEVDLAILALPITAKYLESEPLFDEELYLVLAPQHPLVKQKRIVAADLDSQPFVLLDEAHCLSDQIVTFCRQRSMQPVSVERANQLMTIQELVALDHGVSMVPAMARRIDQSDRRVYRSLADHPAHRTIAMVWNPYRFQSRLLSAFKDELRSYAKAFKKQLRTLK